MHVPFHRFAWIAAALWLPAALGGWGSLFNPDAVNFYALCFGIAFLICLVLVPLSWSDHVGRRTGRGCVGCLLLIAALGGTFWLLLAMGNRQLVGPLSSALIYLVPVLLFALTNPEGLTPLLLLVQAFVAGGLAVGPAAPQYRLGLGLGVPLLAFGLGLGASLVRRATSAQKAMLHRE